MEKANIDQAITTHVQWKKRLGEAIESGQSDFDPAVVKQPDKCEFGKWLYGDSISREARTSTYYETTVNLHAKFHLEAAKVLELALHGHKDQAKERMGPGSEFAKLSSRLIDTLNEWNRKGIFQLDGVYG